ncbi:TPA: phage portal protein [Aeromonas hydrophila]|uniref:Phage portal protein n=1 Tax=Aeromonas hydrophila TaxID=644 RepID=A0AAD3YKM2_AERHY|nr:phage portal protein [Aeromonas hydrophila]
MFKHKKNKNNTSPHHKGLSSNQIFHGLSLPEWAKGNNPALQEPTVLACLNLINRNIMSMPLSCKYQGKYYNRFSQSLNDTMRTILIKPNENETPMQLVSAIVSELVLNNECYIQVKRGNSSGHVREIQILSGVSRQIQTNGKWRYIGLDNSGIEVKQNEVHYLTVVRTGVQTLNVLQQLNSVIELSKTTLRHADNFYNAAPINSGFILSPNTIDDEDFQRIRESVNIQSQQGGYGILDNGLTFSGSTGFNYKDAMSYETRKQLQQDIVAVMGVPAQLLGFEWAGNTDIATLRSSFLSNTINPIVTVIEEFFNTALWSFGIEVDFTEENLLNADYIQQAQTKMDQYKLGLISKNEARLGLTELSPEQGGNDFVIDSNNLTIGAAGSKPNIEQ